MYRDPLRPLGSSVKDPFLDLDHDGISDMNDSFIDTNHNGLQDL